MTRVLVQIIAQAALFLEFADDATLDPDSAVKQLEDMSSFSSSRRPTAVSSSAC